MFAMRLSGGKQAARRRSIFPSSPIPAQNNRTSFRSRILCGFSPLQFAPTLLVCVHFFSRSVHSLLARRDASARETWLPDR